VDYFDYDRFSDFNIEEFLEKSQEQERKRLEKELKQIEDQLNQRDRLHEELIEEIGSKLDWYLERLDTMYKQSRGKSGERDQLKKKIDEFYRELREQKQQHWQDRQKLEKERRDIIRELEELDESVLDLF
jgi:chromosome segregation ATPase